MNFQTELLDKAWINVCINPEKRILELKLRRGYLKATEIKTEISKEDLVKFISFCTAKETISEMKRQSTDWKKYLQMMWPTKA